MSECSGCGKEFASGDAVVEVTVVKYDYDTEMIDQVGGIMSWGYCKSCIEKLDTISIPVRDTLRKMEE